MYVYKTRKKNGGNYFSHQLMATPFLLMCRDCPIKFLQNFGIYERKTIISK